MGEHTILIGAGDWQYPKWQGTYYPADLPEEWQLAYYGNEFPVVMVASSKNTSHDDIAQWLEETDSSPDFIFELPLSSYKQPDLDVISEWLELVSPLKNRTQGILIPVSAHWKNYLSTLLTRLENKYSINLDIMESSTFDEVDELLRVCEGYDVGFCWDGITKTHYLDLGSLAVTRLRENKMGPKQLRQVLEVCLSVVSSSRSVVLLLDGDNPEIETLRTAVTILGLLE